MSAVDFADGDEAVELAAGYGLAPDPWQAAFIRSVLARDRFGKLAAGRAGQSVARQNGKNGELEVLELHKMVFQGRSVLHTAHEVKTARKAFNRLCGFFENRVRWPELAELVVEIRRTNGQEAIRLVNGGSCEFSARSRGAARGFTVDDLVCDEAQELTEEQLEALLPTISAAPSGDPQQLFMGTPPSESMASTVWRRMRSVGVDGSDARLLWEEWSIPDDFDPREAVRRFEELAAETNPALGRRLLLTTVSDEVSAMSPDGFCRERLGQWLSRAKTGPFPVGSWDAGVDVSSVIADGSVLVFCVDVSFDRKTSHVGVAGFRPDGRPHVEVVASRVGTGWVRDWFTDRCSPVEPVRVVVQARGAPVSSLIEDLRKVDGLTVVPWGGVELGNATAHFYDLVSASLSEDAVVRAGAVAHLPQPVLDVAAAAAAPKILSGGGMVWDRRGSQVDVAPLTAVTGALWYLQKEPQEVRSAYESSGLMTLD